MYSNGSKKTETILIEDLPTEVFLPHLDNGWVVEVETSREVVLTTDPYSAGGLLSGHFAVVTYHTAEGEEAYIIAPLGTRITFAR